MINTGIDHKKILFIDIETVTGSHKLFEAPESTAVAWAHICENRYKEESNNLGMLYQKYAALYPEFGKIACISMGYFRDKNDFAVKAYYDGDEKKLIENFTKTFTQLSARCNIVCGHNIKKFDIPYIIRRSLVMEVNLPVTFDLYNKKPWEIKEFIDTLEIWQGIGTSLGSSSLESIAAAFGFKSPKEEMSGSMVSTFYHLPEGPDFKKIGHYCNFDVISTAGIYIKMTLPTIKINVVENIV